MGVVEEGVRFGTGSGVKFKVYTDTKARAHVGLKPRLSDERKEKSAPGPRQLIQSKGVKLEMSPRTSARYCSAARSKARRSEAKT